MCRTRLRSREVSKSRGQLMAMTILHEVVERDSGAEAGDEDEPMMQSRRENDRLLDRGNARVR